MFRLRLKEYDTIPKEEKFRYRKTSKIIEVYTKERCISLRNECFRRMYMRFGIDANISTCERLFNKCIKKVNKKYGLTLRPYKGRAL